MAVCQEPRMTIDLSTTQSNIELMRTAFAALGRKDADVVVALIASDFIINIAGIPYQKLGTDTWRRHAEILLRRGS
jgi:ketosteroid isomerase-like protein